MTLKILVGDSSFALSEKYLLGQDRFRVISGIWLYYLRLSNHYLFDE